MISNFLLRQNKLIQNRFFLNNSAFRQFDSILNKNIQKSFSENNKEYIKKNPTLKEHYEKLGIHKNFSKEEVKSSYIKLAKIYHPDISKDENLNNKFLEIKHSYDILLDHFDKINKEKKNTLDIEETDKINDMISIIFSDKNDNSAKGGNDGNDPKFDIHRFSLNNNFYGMDYIDVEHLKKHHRKRLLKSQKMKLAEILLKEKLESSRLQTSKKEEINTNSEKFLNLIAPACNRKNILQTYFEILQNYKIYILFKKALLKFYEIIIKIIPILCISYFIWHSFHKKIGIALGIYLTYMLLVS